MKNSGGEIFEALGGLFVNCWQVEDGSESSSRKSSEEISGNVEILGMLSLYHYFLISFSVEILGMFRY